ncbi:ABC transporter ATP-binding protein [Seohaeicola saemankumensis]|uniref:ABC transporter ATP-binding protein n=1 Tax=Seohaeicola saemankumensis TaxID=481181 RepID=A0ABW3T9S4_9RHOB
MLEIASVNSFYGKAHVLSDLSFSVQRGQVAALLGRNGAGKSTTMKSIMQLVAPRSGQVRFMGKDLVGLAPHRVAKMGLGYVPEDRRIFTDLTVLENLEVGRQPPREGTVTWTRDMLFDLFPNLAERRNNRGKEMSGGEQQMLTIARTLMGNPSFVLLDEPSEGIAPVIVEQMARVILQLKSEGLTVLLSEQNLHFARAVADVAIIIEGGAQKFHGSLAELNAHPEIRDAYLSV